MSRLQTEHMEQCTMVCPCMNHRCHVCKQNTWNSVQRFVLALNIDVMFGILSSGLNVPSPPPPPVNYANTVPFVNSLATLVPNKTSMVDASIYCPFCPVSCDLHMVKTGRTSMVDASRYCPFPPVSCGIHMVKTGRTSMVSGRSSHRAADRTLKIK